MKQYKITSATFNLEGNDPSIPDAYVDPAQLAELKKLAGIDSLGLLEKTEPSPITGEIGTSKLEYERKHNIKPGTDEWFKLWFARPGLTGENPTPKK